MMYRRHIDIACHPVTFYSRQRGNRPYVLDLSFKCQALSKEASSTIFKVFGMTRPGIEPTTSRTPGEHSTTRPPGAVYYIITNHRLYMSESTYELYIIMPPTLNFKAIPFSASRRYWAWHMHVVVNEATKIYFIIYSCKWCLYFS